MVVKYVKSFMLINFLRLLRWAYFHYKYIIHDMSSNWADQHDSGAKSQYWPPKIFATGKVTSQLLVLFFEKIHPKRNTFLIKHIPLWSHSVLFPFKKKHKKSTYSFDHIPRRVHFVLITIKKEHIPKRADLEKSTFRKEHIWKRAHSKIWKLQKRAHFKKGTFQKGQIQFWNKTT